MLTCRDCKDEACSYTGSGWVSCEDFTGEAIEEETVERQPTLEEYRWLLGEYDKRGDEISQLETRLTGYERAVAELVRFAQEDERP